MQALLKIDEWHDRPVMAVQGPPRQVRTDGQERRAANRPWDMTEARLDVLLEIWAQWMRTGRWVDGYPGDVPVLEGRYRYGADLEEMMDASDTQLAEHVNACIDGLSANHRCAIDHKYLASVWRMRLPLAELLAQARQQLRAALMRRGVE